MVRLGIIGCGQIAQQHFANYKNIPDAEVVICADINGATAEASAQKWEVPHWTTDFREILQRDDVDAVDICLHNNFHMPATVAVLESGKHAYCEKPMAGSYADAATMLEVAKRTGKHLHIQLANIYSNETRAAKELIDLGELGEVFHARSTGFRRRGRPYVDGYGTPTFVQKRFSSGGATYDMGVYHISEILYLLGNPDVNRVSGKTYQKMDMDARRRESSGYDVEELALGFVRLAGGVSMDIIEAWAINLGSLEGSSIVGSKGGVRLHPFSFHKSYGNLDIDGTAGMGSANFRWKNVEGTGGFYDSSQAHWIAALQGQVPLIPTAEIALNTMLISEGIFLSEALDREVTAEEVRTASKSTAVPI